MSMFFLERWLDRFYDWRRARIVETFTGSGLYDISVFHVGASSASGVAELARGAVNVLRSVDPVTEKEYLFFLMALKRSVMRVELTETNRELILVGLVNLGKYVGSEGTIRWNEEDV